MGDRLAALLDADRRLSEVVSALFVAHKDRGGHIINCTDEEWLEQTAAIAARDDARAALIPTEHDAIKLMRECYTRLKDLGWNDAIYCPKDGSEFDAIEVGSTGIFPTHYDGEWPNGHWWASDGGDLWPARPCLYRMTEAEKSKRVPSRALTTKEPTNV